MSKNPFKIYDITKNTDNIKKTDNNENTDNIKYFEKFTDVETDFTYIDKSDYDKSTHTGIVSDASVGKYIVFNKDDEPTAYKIIEIINNSKTFVVKKCEQKECRTYYIDSDTGEFIENHKKMGNIINMIKSIWSSEGNKGGKTKRNKHTRKSKNSRKHRRSRKHSKKHTK